MSEKVNTAKKIQKATAVSTKAAKKAKKVPEKSFKIMKSKEVVSISDEESSEEEESGSDSGSDSKEESSSELEKNVKDKNSLESAKSYSAYSAPPSFKLVLPSSSSTPNPFTPKNLEGKEIWFITAPSSVPLSKIGEIDPVDISEGNPILKAKDGRRYCLRGKNKAEGGDDEEAAAGISIAVPDEEGGYRIMNKSISKTLQLVEALPSPSTISTSQIPKSKPIREQPEGLRMRFKPIGFEGPEEPVSTDVDMIDVSPAMPEKVRKANGDGEERKKKKHKSGRGGGVTLKEKKKRKISKKKAKAVEA